MSTQKVNLLDEIFGKEDSDKEYLYKIDDNLYRVKSYYSDFEKNYEKLSSIDLIEGLVLKKINSKLEIGIRENNNSNSQIKIRKPCKIYSF